MAIRLGHDGDDFAETHEINVTPFVDVVLVLLIIFMMTAHVMEFGIVLTGGGALLKQIDERQLLRILTQELDRQHYLHPHPRELMLRNHV